MKISISIMAVILAIYTLLENGLYKIEGEVIWSIHPDLFYKFLIPILIIIIGILSIRYKNDNKLLILLAILIGIDLVGQLSQIINLGFASYLYSSSQQLDLSQDFTLVKRNLLPTYFAMIIESTLLVFCYMTLKLNTKNSKDSYIV